MSVTHNTQQYPSLTTLNNPSLTTLQRVKKLSGGGMLLFFTSDNIPSRAKLYPPCLPLLFKSLSMN
ncbi:hypothetical protein HanXRQr2_Chr09g0417881 [Helianthus annuus]|uniref:Uncharacterized protein n=1 Tax=Helianthus annuus TaxID=4232 RepID=A0A9K3IBC1_HELAN|nr:hypothetical protein HanXRQr2_Chr09g0417881 [Helianthus annuus]